MELTFQALCMLDGIPWASQLSEWVAAASAEALRLAEQGADWKPADASAWQRGAASPGRLLEPAASIAGVAAGGLERILEAMQTIDPGAAEMRVDHLQRYLANQPRVKDPKSRKKGQAGLLRWEDPRTLVGVAQLLKTRKPELRRALRQPEPQAPIEAQLTQALESKKATEEQLQAATGRVTTLQDTCLKQRKALNEKTTVKRKALDALRASHKSKTSKLKLAAKARREERVAENRKKLQSSTHKRRAQQQPSPMS